MLQFQGSLTPMEQDGSFGIILPQEILETIPKTRIRLRGTIQEQPFDLAIHKSKSGEKYLKISNFLKKKCKLALGGKYQLQFEFYSTDIVYLPEELLAALEFDPEAKNKFNHLTPGIQRSLAHYISSAVNPEVRVKRTWELLDKVKFNQLYSQNKLSKEQ